MLNVNNMDPKVVADISEQLNLLPDEAHTRIAQMSVYDAVDAWLRWHGINGYTGPILDCVRTVLVNHK